MVRIDPKEQLELILTKEEAQKIIAKGPEAVEFKLLSFHDASKNWKPK